MALSLLRPQYVVPFHGDYRHMAIYRKLAMSMAWPADHVLLAETGVPRRIKTAYLTDDDIRHLAAWAARLRRKDIPDD